MFSYKQSLHDSRLSPLFMLIACSITAACSRTEAPRTEEPIPVASVAQALGLDAAELEPSVDPTPPAGDLAGELAHFTTLEACVKEHAAMDPLVGDALRSIGYDTFLRDTCRLLEAAKSKNADRCGTIDASALRDRCTAYVAIVAGNPDACPWLVPGDHARGREPTCVAAAARDPRLCAGTEHSDRVACEAMATRSDKPCATLPDPMRAECQREAIRWRGVITDPVKTDAIAAPEVRLEITTTDGSAAPLVVSTIADLERGLVLVQDGLGDHFSLGAAHEMDLGLKMALPGAGPHVSLSATLVKDPPVEARLDRLEVGFANGPALSCPSLHCDVRLTVKKLERARAGLVSLTLEAGGAGEPGSQRVNGTVTTFVRDVVRQGVRALGGGVMKVLP